jgi:ABC-type Mn2+/Zn2+ transport system permease subunit
VPDATSPNSGTKPRRWTVIAAGLLCGLLALVVIYTNPRAFRSPLAAVVVAAIGLAAVLAQLRFYNSETAQPVHAPTWLNVIGILFAVAALFADVLRLTSHVAQTMVLGAVLSFSISSAVILHAFRKGRPTTPK